MGQTGVIKQPILYFYLVSLLLMLSQFYNVLRGIGKPYVERLCSQSDLALGPSLWVKLGSYK